jgi:hypothetical protein
MGGLQEETALIRYTHTFVLLEISRAAFDEIKFTEVKSSEIERNCLPLGPNFNCPRCIDALDHKCNQMHSDEEIRLYHSS